MEATEFTIEKEQNSIKKEIALELEAEGKTYIEPNFWSDFQKTLYEMGIDSFDFYNMGGEG
jgi:hypothetical protein